MIYENQEYEASGGLEGSNWPSFPGYMRENAPVPKSRAPRFYINNQTRCIAEFKDLQKALKYFDKHQRSGWFFTAYDPTPREYAAELRHLRQEQRTRPYL